MDTLKRDVKRLINALEDLGFGDESADISGSDTVDLVNEYLSTINRLPDLLALRDAVADLIKAKGRFHTEQNYQALAAAYEKVK